MPDRKFSKDDMRRAYEAGWRMGDPSKRAVYFEDWFAFHYPPAEPEGETDA